MFRWLFKAQFEHLARQAAEIERLESYIQILDEKYRPLQDFYEDHQHDELGAERVRELCTKVEELEAKLSRSEMALHIAEEDAGNALGRVEELEAAQTPRPMSEAPMDGTMVRCFIEISAEYITPGFYSTKCADGWLPCPPDQEVKS